MASNAASLPRHCPEMERIPDGGSLLAAVWRYERFVRPPEPSLEGLRTEQKEDEQTDRDLCRAVGTEQEQSGTVSQENPAAAQQSPGTVGDVEYGSAVATISIPYDTPNLEAQIQRYVKPVTRLFAAAEKVPPLLILANKAFLFAHLASARSRSDLDAPPIVTALLTALLPPALLPLEQIPPMRAKVCIAVVDSIPGTTHADGCVRNQGSEEPQIAYAFCQHTFFTPQAEASLTPATLTLTFRTHENGKDCTVPDDSTLDTKVQLPLANTIFVSGGEYSSLQEHGFVTLIRQADGSRSWQGYHAYQYVRSAFALFHTGFTSLEHPAEQSSIVAPLVPLTAPRKVSASLGNIVRQVERNGEAVSASKELEDVVNEGIKNGVLPSGPVQVWALITGSDVITKTGRTGLSITQLSATHQKETKPSAGSDAPLQAETMTGAELQRELKEMLGAGSRLHRVLSGGGGWGKKAGLISLSPAVGFGDEKADIDKLLRSAAETEEDEAKGIQDVLGSPIREGDHLQFLLTSPMQKPAALHQPSQGDTMMDFGTIPSTIDDVPLPKPQHGTQDESIRKDIVVMPDRFGALSETGISISYASTSRRQVERNFQTMLDVPHSRLRISWPYLRIMKDEVAKAQELVEAGKIRKAEKRMGTANERKFGLRRLSLSTESPSSDKPTEFASKPSDSARLLSESVSRLWEAAYDTLCQFIRNQVEEEVQKRLGQDKDSTEVPSGLPGQYRPIEVTDSEDQNLAVSHKAGAQDWWDDGTAADWDPSFGSRGIALKKQAENVQKKPELTQSPWREGDLDASTLDSTTELEEATSRAEMREKITAILNKL